MAAAFASLALVACGETAGPLPSSSYALRSVDGRALPAQVPSVGTVTVSLVADTLHFFDDGRFTRVRVRLEDPVTGSPALVREDARGEVVRRGGSLVLEAMCGDTPGSLAICVPPDTARFLGALLEIENSFLPPGGRYLFESVGP